jgi:hypothetical protein
MYDLSVRKLGLIDRTILLTAAAGKCMPHSKRNSNEPDSISSLKCSL